MHSLQVHPTKMHFFILALKIGECSNLLISLGKISHIFGAKDDIVLVQYLTDLIVLLSNNYFLKVQNYIDVTQTLYLKGVGQFPCITL